jgi:hypothetical protein
VGLGQEVAARPHGVGDVQGQRLIRHPDLSPIIFSTMPKISRPINIRS